MNQNNYGLPTYYVKSNPLSIENLRTPMPQGIEIPRFGKYNEKGYPTSHVNAFTTLCSEFVLHERILAKIFPKTLREGTLEFFSSFQNNSIHSF
jgi:hypothetical protein